MALAAALETLFWPKNWRSPKKEDGSILAHVSHLNKLNLDGGTTPTNAGKLHKLTYFG